MLSVAGNRIRLRPRGRIVDSRLEKAKGGQVSLFWNAGCDTMLISLDQNLRMMGMAFSFYFYRPEQCRQCY